MPQRRPRRRALALHLTAIAATLTACSHSLEGPEPQLAAPAPGAPLAPAYVCGEQLTTAVTLSGSALAPLVNGLPADARTTLPTVTLSRSAGLGGESVDTHQQVYDGNAAESTLMTWQSSEQMTLEVNPELALPPGLYDIDVVNAQGASVQDSAPLAVVHAPELADIAPGVLCLAQGERPLTATGAGFFTIDGAPAEVSINGGRLPVDTFSGCTDVPHPSVPAQFCTQADITVPVDFVDPGVHPVVVHNPETAACNSEESVDLRIVPPPRLDRAEPPLACANEGPREVVLLGADILIIDDVKPVVTMTDPAGAPVELVVGDLGECEDLPTRNHTVQRCNTVNVTVPQLAVEAPYQPTIELTNPAPAGCNGTAETALTLVPPPDVAEVQPLYLCRNVETIAVAITGQDFLTVEGAPPIVTLGDQTASAVAPSGCEELAVDGLAVQRCTALEATFAPGDLNPAESIRVENPQPAGCSDTFEQRLVVLDPPAPVAAEPALICTADGERQLVVTGEHFVEIDGARPSVRIGDTTVEASALDDCAEQTEGALTWQDCGSLTVTLPQGSLPEGQPLVEVIGPAPAACVGGIEGIITVPPSVVIDSVDPNSICTEAGDREIVISGNGFLRVDGVEPELTLNGDVFAATLGGCAPLMVEGRVVENCTTLTTLVPRGSLVEGDVAVAVTHADPALCDNTAEGVFFIVPVPVIEGIEPVEVCEADVDTFTIRGQNFTPVSTVTLGDVEATAVEFVDANTLIATFADGLLPGTYDLLVSNGEGCEDTAPAILEVHPTPIVFFVDPPIAYNGINLQVTIYTTGLDAAPDTVHLVGPGGEDVLLDDARPAPDRPNKIFATVPAGLAVGEWTVRVTSRLGCEGELPGALTVTDDLRIGLTAIDPTFVAPDRATAVSLLAEAVDDEVGFQSTPRAYLNPNPADPDSLATAVRAVVYIEEGTLTGVVPADMPPGNYDVIVVNPDATVGLLEAGLTVTANQPPIVDGVEPASLDGNGPQNARIIGSDFAVEDGGTVEMTCRTPEGMTGTAPANIVSSTPSEVVAALPGDAFPAGSVCLIVLTNADGASSRFSAVSIKTPAQNLNEWDAAPALTTPRRAPGAVAGRPTRTSRYLYAIGGDDGAVANAYTSIEASSVDTFGDMGDWIEQRNALPAPRTFAGVARLGRYVYLVGGNDGATAVDTIWRARILDPLAGPEVVDLGLTIEDDAPNIGAGLWHYRVSAVFPDDYAPNPGGETLPGEVLVVELPEIEGLQITLRWDPVPGASGYRVYRTAAAGDGVDTVRLVAEVAETSFTDAGAEAGDATPMPPGSLGVWHPAGTLGTAREASAVIAVPDAAGGWLYAIGGRDAAGNVLSTYEMARIGPDGLLGPVMVGASQLGAARAELGVVQVTRAELDAIPADQPWLFVGPGRTAGGFSRAVDATGVGPDGSLEFIPTDTINGDAAGYGMGGANGFLFIFGGRGGANDGGISAEICRTDDGPGCGQAPDVPADLRNWNNLGVRMTVPRIYMGIAQESAFFFIVGGHDGMNTLSAVDQTVQ